MNIFYNYNIAMFCFATSEWLHAQKQDYTVKWQVAIPAHIGDSIHRKDISRRWQVEKYIELYAYL